MENTATPTNQSAPTYIAYQVRESGEKKSYWTRIGAAWAHKDGKGFSLQLNSLPKDGSISLRVPSKKQ